MDAEADREELSENGDDEPAENQGADIPSTEESDTTDWEDQWRKRRERRAKREAHEAALARAALHTAPPPDNHLGLVMAVSERTSDLAWILAIENRSAVPVKLAALPALLRAKVTPPEEPAAEDEPDPAVPRTPAEPAEPTICEGAASPTSISEDDNVELLPGQLLFHAFDPRELCDGDAPLREGASVEVSYGFPLQTKKLWKGGKLTTVEIEQTAPFVAEREPSGAEVFVPLKFLNADPIRLDQTYPLSAVSALPKEAGSTTNSESEPAPPPPLELKIFPLGTSSAPEQGVVTVQLRNTSGKTMQLFIRRELFTYEVSGPTGEATCSMYPADRAPDPGAFSTLAPGETRSLSTRLAEACPEGIWDEPGTYSVSAFFQATADGSEHDLDAFMGTAATKSAARLTVPGADKKKVRRMKIAPSQPPEN